MGGVRSRAVFFGRFTVRGLNGFQGELHIATRGFDVRLIGEIAKFTNLDPEDDLDEQDQASLAIGFRIPWGEHSQDRARRVR